MMKSEQELDDQLEKDIEHILTMPDEEILVEYVKEYPTMNHQSPLIPWTERMTKEQLEIIRLAQDITTEYMHANIIGRLEYETIADMAEQLEIYRRALFAHVTQPVVEPVHWDDASKTYRSLITGVRFDIDKHPLLQRHQRDMKQEQSATPVDGASMLSNEPHSR